MDVSEKGLTCAKDSLGEISQVGSDQGGFEAGKGIVQVRAEEASVRLIVVGPSWDFRRGILENESPGLQLCGWWEREELGVSLGFRA